MKKILFLASLAAVAMTSCTSESNEYVGDNTPKEIAFMPVNQMATRAAIEDGVFPTGESMQVAAYQVEPTASAGNYFSGTTFAYNSAATTAQSGTPIWSGNPTKRYWPLSACYINFLAYANVTGTATFDGTTPASAATITMTDNSSAQKDLVYAIGNGAVTQSVNVLSFPANVGMAFQHAQSLIAFRVKAYGDAEASAITVKKIILNNAYYAGTFVITHTNYNAKASQSVDGLWTSVSGQKATLDVPGSASISINKSTFTDAGSVLVVPNSTQTTPPTVDPSFDSFTVEYTFDSKDYSYTYVPDTPSGRVLTKATKYVYDITFKLHEIMINPSVASWGNGGTGSITIQE